MSILHIIPLSVADPIAKSIDLDRLRSQTSAWIPWGAGGYNARRNFDGFVTYSAAEGTVTRAYIQVFRSGMIEVVATGGVRVRGATRTVWVDHLAQLYF